MEYETTQREIKRLITAGAAIELTDTKTEPCGRLKTVAMSFGIYGMNGGLFRDTETGQLYGIPRRDGILFYYLLTMENMKQTLKATAAIIGIVAAAVVLNYIIKALGCLMIYISETCNVPL